MKLTKAIDGLVNLKAKKDPRYELDVLHISKDVFEVTDGYSAYTLPHNTDLSADGLPDSFFIPGEMLREAIKVRGAKGTLEITDVVDGEITILINGNTISKATLPKKAFPDISKFAIRSDQKSEAFCKLGVKRLEHLIAIAKKSGNNCIEFNPANVGDAPCGIVCGEITGLIMPMA